MYSRNLWLGVFDGLYGHAVKTERPTDECFGAWIPEKRLELATLKRDLTRDFWAASMDDAEMAAYDIVDLLFLNDQYCHFRSTFWDVQSYMWAEGVSLGGMFSNLQTNAFPIITEVSKAASIFKATPWDEMDSDEKAYTLN